MQLKSLLIKAHSGIFQSHLRDFAPIGQMYPSPTVYNQGCERAVAKSMQAGRCTINGSSLYLFVDTPLADSK